MFHLPFPGTTFSFTTVVDKRPSALLFEVDHSQQPMIVLALVVQYIGPLSHSLYAWKSLFCSIEWIEQRRFHPNLTSLTARVAAFLEQNSFSPLQHSVLLIE